MRDGARWALGAVGLLALVGVFGRGRGSRSEIYPYLPLGLILRIEPEMARRGVSRVARGSRGFLRAYERAHGRSRRLGFTPSSTPRREPYPWAERRQEFLARHLGQLRMRGEPLWTADGDPTDRHLALVAWAYSPDPARLRRWASKLERA